MPGTEDHPRSAGGSSHGRHTSQRRVRDIIAASVRGGVFDLDAQLIEDVLIETLGASRNAVRRALQSLTDEGKMLRKPRLGTFPTTRGVKLNVRDFAISGDGLGSIKLIDQGLVPTIGLLKDRLQTTDSKVRMVENLFLYDGVPIGVRTAYYREIYLPSEAVEIIDMQSLARELFALNLGASTTEIGASTADHYTCKLLQVPENSAVLTREQLFLDDTGAPFQINFDHYRADYVSFVDGA